MNYIESLYCSKQSYLAAKAYYEYINLIKIILQNSNTLYGYDSFALICIIGISILGLIFKSKIKKKQI